MPSLHRHPQTHPPTQHAYTNPNNPHTNRSHPTTIHPNHSALTPGRKRADSEDYESVDVPERFLAACHGKKKKARWLLLMMCTHVFVSVGI